MIGSLRQKAIEKVFYPLLARYHGSRELAVLRRLLKSERFSEEQLHLLRLERLKALLRHAAHYVPFYRERFAAAGFDPARVNSLDDLSRLPILTKSQIQEHGAELLSSYFKSEELTENRTGGSTGAPLKFYHHRGRMDSRQAATLRHNLWAGYRIGCKVAIIWGHQIDLSLFTSTKARVRNWLIDRTLIADAASFSDEGLRRFSKRFKSFKPEIVLAYANSAAAVVDFCHEHGITLPAPRSVITSAEVLSEQSRRSIEDFFSAPVFDRYGCREVSVIASECEAHQGMHINAENLIVEFLDGERPVAPGEQGEIIVTDLGNYAFPFIRYHIGDVGSPLGGNCPCGRTLPRMAMVAGRTSDFLLAADGRRVSGTALTILLAAKVQGVRQAQIVQRELGRLILRLVTDGSFGEASERLIEGQVAHFFGEKMRYSLEFVDEIPREPSGKYRFSIREIW